MTSNNFNYGLMFGFAAGFLVGLSVSTARSEELSEIDARSASYCALYSRQMVFTEMTHGEGFTADTDVINGLAIGHYRECISILPTLLPLPKDKASHEQWLADIRDLVIVKAGTEPAVEKIQTAGSSDEEWRAQCRSEYSTWDEETATVIRRGNPDRVRCPCGVEVVCERD